MSSVQQLSGAMRILTEISKDRGLAHTTEVGDLFLNPRNYIPDLCRWLVWTMNHIRITVDNFHNARHQYNDI